MPNPITGTQVRHVALYPFPGFDPQIVTLTGGGVFDSTGDILFFTVWLNDGDHSFVCKYVYSTDTLTAQFAILPTPVSHWTGLLWNGARTKLIGFYPAGGNTQFYEIDPTTGAVVTLGLVSGIALDRIGSDVNGVFIGKEGGGTVFYSIDINAGTIVSLFQVPRFCDPIFVEEDFIYTASANGNPGQGPMIRIHRNRGYLTEFLAGSLDSIVPFSTNNPEYAAFILLLSQVYSVGNTVYMIHQESGVSHLLAFDKTTRSVNDILSPMVGGGYQFPPFLAFNDSGDFLASLAADQGIYFYT